VIKVGIIGFSEANGHPYSFSSIINGYNEKNYQKSNWKLILNYLKKQPEENFGFDDVMVTHAYTQDPEITESICKCSNIPNKCLNLDDFYGSIDAVIIGRDDWRSHFRLSIEFLKRGIPVFIDKPLSFSQNELNQFRPYIESAKLMSCSGFRYCTELESIKLKREIFDNQIKIDGFVVNDLEKYGIHLIEALAGVSKKFSSFKSIRRLKNENHSFLITFDDNSEFNLNCMGKVEKIFNLQFIFGENKISINLENNFMAFRRTLYEFFNMIKTKNVPIDFSETNNIMRLIMEASKLNHNESVDFL
jgi:hypothetical protein